MGVAFAVLAMLSFASNILITRVALKRMSVDAGFPIVLAANVVTPGILFAIAETQRTAPFVWDWKGVGLFAIGGIVGTILGRRALFDAVKLLGAARASVFHSSAPAFAFLGAWLLAGEKVALRDMALIVLVWVGLWLTQPPAGSRPGEELFTPEMRRRGMIAGFIAVAGFGFGNVLRGLAVRAWDEVFFGTMLSSVAALTLQIIITRDWSKVRRDWRSAGPRGIALYAASGIATGLGSIFVTFAMKNISIGLAVLMVHTTPLVIFPVSVFILKRREDLNPRTLGGTGLVLAGVASLLLK
jgi:drug/metabolite transporter (DMT)-like permease